MTRKDFVLISNALKQGQTYAIYLDRADVRSFYALQCEAMAAALRSTNSQFDRYKFLKACGLSDDDIEAL